MSMVDERAEAEAEEDTRIVLREIIAVLAEQTNAEPEPTTAQMAAGLRQRFGHEQMALALVMSLRSGAQMYGRQQADPAVRAAHEVLRAVMANDPGTAQRTLYEGAHSRDGAVYTMCIAWCDAYVQHALDGAGEPVRVGGIVMIGEDGKQVDEPGPEFQWVGKLLEARSVLDDTGFNALFEQTPEEHFAQYVWTLASSVGQTMGTLPRGWAVLGQTRPGHAPGCDCP